MATVNSDPIEKENEPAPAPVAKQISTLSTQDSMSRRLG